MASGVRPKEDLEKAGVMIVKDLPHVGKNIFDVSLSPTGVPDRVQPTFGLGLSSTYLLCVIFRATESPNYWHANRLFGPNRAAAEDTTSGKHAPDLELICASLVFAERRFWMLAPGEKALTIATTLLRPQSTRQITIKSGDVWENAVIEPNYLVTPHDMKTMVQGGRWTRGSRGVPGSTWRLQLPTSTSYRIPLPRLQRAALCVPHTKPLASKLAFRPENKDTASMFFMGDADPDTVTDEVIEDWLRRETETLLGRLEWGPRSRTVL
ncbi:hypothetical protein FRC06_001306 [Ceratobasidium sp. 370]|nr:hypothetical protein FRC06_001306 [Ceratobasidium sp. 370]